MPKLLKHSISYLLVSVYVLQQVFFSLSFAQTTQPSCLQYVYKDGKYVCKETDKVTSCQEYTPDCEKTPVCSAQSEEFQMYINFVIDMITVIKASAAKQEAETEKPSVGLIASKVIWPKNKQLATIKLGIKFDTQWFLKWFNAMVAGIALFVDIGKEMLGDALASFIVLFREKPFVREWWVLLDLESSLHDLMFELSVWWFYTKKIDVKYFPQIQQVLDRYTVSQPFFDFWYITPWTTFSDVVRTLFRLTTTMKNFIWTPWNKAWEYVSWLKKNSFFKDPNEFIQNPREEAFGLQFKEETICIMEKNYQCVSAGACSKSLAEIFKDLTDISQLKDAFKSSLDMIKKSNADLKAALAQIKGNIAWLINKKNKRPELTQLQQDLLRTVYGIDAWKLSRGEGIGLADLFSPSNFRSLKIKGDLSPLDYFSKSAREKRTQTKEELARQKKEANDLAMLARKNADLIETNIEKNPWNPLPSAAFTGAIQQAMNSVFTTHIRTADRMTFGQSTDITRTFPQISAYITRINDELIWTKDTQWIIKFLGKACELQCANRWIGGCYAQ